MNVLRWLIHCSVLLALVAVSRVSDAAEPTQTDSLCPEPALSRVVRHRVTQGETLVSLARRYNLIPATLMGMNPVLRSGNPPVGAEILIPPYNGVRVEIPTGRSWQDVAASYGVRADVLYEVNGCQRSPRVVFVPGVNWSPNPTTRATATTQANRVLRGYPLPAVVPVIRGYGWQVESQSGQVVFNSGVDLGATAGTPVLSVGDGTVAFAEEQGNYGKLVVINHNEGLQTRYANLDAISVRAGQTIRAGDRIGTVGSTGQSSRPRLHFEVRSNSDLGWVAQDPSSYLQNMQVGR
jgi:lysostaphin